MIQSALILSFFGFASAFLYTDYRCHEGPSYWCSSQEVAETCEATNFCKQNIWTSSKEVDVATTNGNLENYVTCKACTFVFSRIESYVFNDENEEKILKAVSKVCDHIPPNMVDTCKTFINTYGKQAIDNLAKKFGPTLACEAIGMCDHAKSESVLLPGIPAPEACEKCKNMTTEIAKEIDVMLTWWQSMCGEADDTERCEELSEYALIVTRAIFTNEICNEMQMCS